MQVAVYTSNKTERILFLWMNETRLSAGVLNIAQVLIEDEALTGQFVQVGV